MNKSPAIILFCGLLFLCSCVTENARKLPSDLPINPSAGRGGFLMVNVQLDNGEKLPFILDSGTTASILDTSLEPKLGKLQATTVTKHWGVFTKHNVYATPKLYLGDVRLKVGSQAVTMDLDPAAARTGKQSVMGILGYDCLRHYCVQLDFAAGRMRLLDDRHADKSNWGRAFHIVALNSEDSRPAVAENLLGLHGPHSLIDSGCTYDGWLMTNYFQQWTNTAIPPPPGEVRSPHAEFAGEKYPLAEIDQQNVESDGIGLRFLARHLVTLDFPRHTMYLARQSIGPLPDPNLKTAGTEALKPIIADVMQEDAEAARRDLAQIEQSNATGLEKTVARKLAATMTNETKQIPADAPAEITELPLGDVQADAAEVGWLKPAANRIPLNGEITSPLLESGKIYATGLYAHPPSRYVFNLGGKWKRLQGEAGLHTAFQGRAYGVVFVVKTDGKEVFRSAAIAGVERDHYDVDLTGVETLELVVEKVQSQNGGNWALWLDPTLFR